MVLAADHPSRTLSATRFDTVPFSVIPTGGDDEARHQRPVLDLYQRSRIPTGYLLFFSLLWAAAPWLILALFS